MNNLRKNLLPITTFTIIDIKRLFRDKVAIFWVFFFPVIFLIIFGSIFNGNSDVSFRIGIINNSTSDFSSQFVENLKSNDIYNVDEEVTDVEIASQKLSRGQLEATIILPEDFGAKGLNNIPGGNAQVLYDESNQQGGQTLASILNATFAEINKGLVEAPTPFTLESKTTAKPGSTQFDYTFSGILGFTILSLGIFGPTTVFPRLKQRGVLKRYKTTTLKVWQYFTGNILSNAFVGVLSVLLMFALALTLFDLNMRGNYFNLAFIVVIGTTMMFGFGLALGGWAKNENQAAPLAQVITLPMLFLSGVFFPTFLMPELLQSITKFIPLTPIIDSARLIITENASMLDLAPQIGIIAAWTVFIYVVAIKVFSWE